MLSGSIHRCHLAAALIVMLGMGVHAQSSATNPPPTRPEPVSGKLDESSFRIVSERNIFNANRSGGTVRSSSSRRPVRVESFALVGTMAYEKGAFAFFEGSSSEFTKVLKTDGIIAGYKLVDILANAVELEINGQMIELPIGSGLRREDQGAWKVSDSISTGNGGGDSSESTGRSGQGRRDEDSSPARSAVTSGSSSSSPAPGADQSEILKRLMERREKESQ